MTYTSTHIRLKKYCLGIIAFAILCLSTNAQIDIEETICEPVPGQTAVDTDRNDFGGDQSDGYLHNFLVPDAPACDCGDAVITSATISVDINAINIAPPLPADCNFFAVFANVYVDSAPILLTGDYIPDHEILQQICGASNGMGGNVGNYSLEIIGCGTTVNAGDNMGIDIIPAIPYGGSAACSGINGNGVGGGHIEVEYGICIDFIFTCADTSPAFIKY